MGFVLQESTETRGKPLGMLFKDSLEEGNVPVEMKESQRGLDTEDDR